MHVFEIGLCESDWKKSWETHTKMNPVAPLFPCFWWWPSKFKNYLATSATYGSLLTTMTSPLFPFFPHSLKVPTGSISLSLAEPHTNLLFTCWLSHSHHCGSTLSLDCSLPKNASLADEARGRVTNCCNSLVCFPFSSWYDFFSIQPDSLYGFAFPLHICWLIVPFRKFFSLRMLWSQQCKKIPPTTEFK